MRYCQIFEHFLQGISFLLDFPHGIFGLIVRISKIQQSSGFSETLLGNFRTISPLLKVPEFSAEWGRPQPVRGRALTRIFVLCSLQRHVILTLPLSTVPWCINGYQRM